MPRHLALRPLERREQQILKAKIRDLSLSARVHQHYRIIEQVRTWKTSSDPDFDSKKD